MTDFYEMPEEEQIRRLARLARVALERWSLQGAEVRPIAYRENMTFAVEDPERGRFALRVHQAGYRTDSQVQSELDFMEYLNDQGIPTPRVVRTPDAASFVRAEHADVKEPRQCDLFEWIDGRPLRSSGEPPDMPRAEAEQRYREVGRLAASIYNASEKWTRPRGFERPCWDPEGIFGANAHLGDFREIERATPDQRTLLSALADRLALDLGSFGRTPDRFGLSQGDFLPENIMVCDEGLRLVDFDDAGESWILFDVVTAVFDLKLVGSDYFEPCLRSFVEGFRELRDLPQEQLAMLQTFYLARLLSYLGHSVSRSHLEQSAGLQLVLLATLEKEGAAYLRGSSGGF